MNPKYTDMVPLPHPVSETHPPMSRENRAAQFAPFAALAGHDAALAETARLTGRRVELDEGELAVLDSKWRCLCEHLDTRPVVTVTWFEADKQKDGGAYRTAVGTIEKIGYHEGCMWLSGGEKIPFCDIAALDSELLYRLAGGEEVF